MNTATIQQEASIFERLLVSPDVARAALSMRFPPQDENRMRALMDKNNQGTITPYEQAEMEAFRRIGSFLAIVQAKARLQLQGEGGHPFAACCP